MINELHTLRANNIAEHQWVLFWSQIDPYIVQLHFTIISPYLSSKLTSRNIFFSPIKFLQVYFVSHHQSHIYSPQNSHSFCHPNNVM